MTLQVTITNKDEREGANVTVRRTDLAGSNASAQPHSIIEPGGSLDVPLSDVTQLIIRQEFDYSVGNVELASTTPGAGPSFKGSPLSHATQVGPLHTVSDEQHKAHVASLTGHDTPAVVDDGESPRHGFDPVLQHKPHGHIAGQRADGSEIYEGTTNPLFRSQSEGSSVLVDNGTVGLPPAGTVVIKEDETPAVDQGFE